MNQPLPKIQVVFGVLLKKRTKTILFFERTADGLWTLPFTDVRDNEYPHEALERRGQELFGLESDLEAFEQLGPAFQLPDGRTAAALVCNADGFELANDEYAQCMFFRSEDLLTAVSIDKVCERPAWDGFSILEEPNVLAAQTDGVEAIYCDPGKEHVLVDESRGQRREWPRLDPKNGEPMAAAS